jgi:hypothetical protein
MELFNALKKFGHIIEHKLWQSFSVLCVLVIVLHMIMQVNANHTVDHL